MMTMLLSVILSCLLASTLAQDEDDCPANTNSPSCDDPADQTICQLTCDRGSGVCEFDEDKCGQIGADVTNDTYPDMYSTRCKAICEESRDYAESPDKICRFYKVSVSTLTVAFPPLTRNHRTLERK